MTEPRKPRIPDLDALEDVTDNTCGRVKRSKDGPTGVWVGLNGKGFVYAPNNLPHLMTFVRSLFLSCADAMAENDPAQLTAFTESLLGEIEQRWDIRKK